MEIDYGLQSYDSGRIAHCCEGKQKAGVADSAIEALEKEAAEVIKETFSEDVQDAEVQNEEDGTEAVAVNEGEDTEPGEGPGAEGEEGSDENKAFVPPFKKNDAAFVKGDIKEGVLEIMPDGFGFIRSENFLPGDKDVYVSPQQIRRLALRTGDIVAAVTKDRMPGDKFNGMLYAKVQLKIQSKERILKI